MSSDRPVPYADPQELPMGPAVYRTYYSAFFDSCGILATAKEDGAYAVTAPFFRDRQMAEALVRIMNALDVPYPVFRSLLLGSAIFSPPGRP